MRTLVLRALLLLGALLAVPGSVHGQTCVGDCDNDGHVAINEVISGVNIGLAIASLSTCPAFDADGDGQVAVNEVITGVNNGLTGCSIFIPTTATPIPPTATPIPTSTPLPTRPRFTPTFTRTPAPPPSDCVSVQQGTWCFEFSLRGLTFLEAEGRLSQRGCFLSFDGEFEGDLTGSEWDVSASTPQGDFDLSCRFSGNPASSCAGNFEAAGQDGRVEANSGRCP